MRIGKIYNNRIQCDVPSFLRSKIAELTQVRQHVLAALQLEPCHPMEFMVANQE